MIRFQSPLEEIPMDKPSLLESMLEFLCKHVQKNVFNDYEKDRGVLLR